MVLCTGHGGDQVREELGDGHALGVHLEYSEEPEPLGTGGALRFAARQVRGPALVMNGDTLVSCDPWVLERARWEAAATGAIALYAADDPASRGRVSSRRIPNSAARRG